MTRQLPQKYQEVAKAIIPYTPEKKETGQMMLIKIEPALPCFLCGNPAKAALITPAAEYAPGQHSQPWLTFPICAECEKRQVTRQTTNSEK
jgi:hypothetical protein